MVTKLEFYRVMFFATLALLIILGSTISYLLSLIKDLKRYIDDINKILEIDTDEKEENPNKGGLVKYLHHEIIDLQNNMNDIVYKYNSLENAVMRILESMDKVSNMIDNAKENKDEQS